MTTVLLVLAGSYGVHLCYSAIVLGWTGIGPGPRASRSKRTLRVAARRWLAQAGLSTIRIGEFAGVIVGLFVIATLGAFAMFGAVAPAIAVGVFAATFPVATYRNQRHARMERAHHAWPRLIEEIRVLTSAAGHSVPQALFEAGNRAPDELREAFDAAHREWLLSTDFSRTIAVLKAELADPTADATCETLLVAHQIGGTDLDARLAALASDRIDDVQTRKDAAAQQAGARFARRFVLLVPLGMAVAGLSVGTGRHSYQRPEGQLLVLIGLTLTIGCWFWAGRMMHLPREERIFDR